MAWGAFNKDSSGRLIHINGYTDQNVDVNVLQDNLDPFSEDLPLNWIFQQGNDPKHA